MALAVLMGTFNVIATNVHSSAIAQVVKHVVPYDSFVWTDDSSEVVVLVRINETGLVQELGVEQMTGKLYAKSEFDTIHRLQIEPFIFEGRTFGTRYSQRGYVGES